MKALKLFLMFIVGVIRHSIGLCPNCSKYDIDCPICGGEVPHSDYQHTERWQRFLSLLRGLYNDEEE